MQRPFKPIGVVSIVALILAAVAETAAALADKDIISDHTVCWRGLTSERSAWIKDAFYAEEAARRGLTVDACRKLIAQPSTAPTTSSESIKQVTGADLFIDLDQYVGKPVIVTDCEIYGTSNSGAILNCHSTYFYVTTDGIDRESFRFFLKNCTGLGLEPQCKMAFLVTPTGQKRMEIQC
jgi:hypothetical protein